MGENKLNHLGIIMDGNGRWAKLRGMNRSLGHREGANTLKKIIPVVKDLGISYLSVYAFSSENFKRSDDEVGFLMNLFIELFNKEMNNLIKEDVKIIFSGRRDLLSSKVLSAMDSIVLKSKDNTGLVVNILLNYSGENEVVDMTKSISNLVKNGDVDIDDIDINLVYSNLYHNLGPLDLVIRTGGDTRLSNFMMLQSSYSEFYFTNVLFPDFLEDEVVKAVEVFNKRERKFGGVDEK